jgi:hypothetical protein
MALQDAVADWHKRRFPKAKKGHLALKVCAELGELAEALLNDDPDLSTHRFPPPSILAEAADTTLVLLALVGRFYPGADLLGAVWAKLAVLDDPDGVHRSSIGAMGDPVFEGDPWGTGAPLSAAEREGFGPKS